VRLAVERQARSGDRVALLRLRRKRSAYSVLKRRGLMDRTIPLERAMGQPRCYPKKEAEKVKTAIIALFSAVLITAAPAVLAQNVSSKTPEQQHKVLKKRSQAVSGYAPWRVVHAKGMKTGYPGATGYVPSAPKDYTYENSRQAGGGGGGGSGM
jgi:hypothetical protein